jgi:hypothetical protein
VARHATGARSVAAPVREAQPPDRNLSLRGPRGRWRRHAPARPVRTGGSTGATAVGTAVGPSVTEAPRWRRDPASPGPAEAAVRRRLAVRRSCPVRTLRGPASAG